MQSIGSQSRYAIVGSFRVAQSIINRLNEQESAVDACRFISELLSHLLKVDGVCLELPKAILPEPILRHGAHHQTSGSTGHERIVPLCSGARQVGTLRLRYPHPTCEGPEDMALAEFAADCLGFLMLDRLKAADSLNRLSPAERRVHCLLYLTNQEISERLCLSHDTVRTHIKHIYKKLDVKTRREALDLGRCLSAG